MKPRKMDRFERMVSQIVKSDEDAGYDAICFQDDVITILRNEHAWMMRMVKKVDAWACQELADNDDVIAEILKQLAQRRK